MEMQPILLCVRWIQGVEAKTLTIGCCSSTLPTPVDPITDSTESSVNTRFLSYNRRRDRRSHHCVHALASHGEYSLAIDQRFVLTCDSDKRRELDRASVSVLRCSLVHFEWVTAHNHRRRITNVGRKMGAEHMRLTPVGLYFLRSGR